MKLRKFHDECLIVETKCQFEHTDHTVSISLQQQKRRTQQKAGSNSLSFVGTFRSKLFFVIEKRFHEWQTDILSDFQENIK
jgi:hypothetical protein